MKHLPIILNGAWALLAVGAYLLGTQHSKPGAAAASSHGAPPTTGPAQSGQAPAAGSAGSGSKAKDAAAEVSQWLRAYQGSGGAISLEQMKEAALAALRNPDPVKAMLYFTHLLEKLTPENAQALLQSIHENVRGADAQRYMGLLAHAWGTLDGGAAIAAFDSLKRRDLDGAKSAAMAAWASKDGEAAMQWLRKRAEQPETGRDSRAEQALAHGVVIGMARQNIDSALEFVMTLKEDVRAEFAHLLVEQKMKESVPSAAEWALRLPDERMRTNAQETVGYQYIKEDFQGAVQWAEKIAARPDAHEAVADVANEMAIRNGKEAATWAAKLPAGPSQNHAMEDIFETWTRTDPLSASQSLNEMSRGPGRDSAVQAFARTLARENPVDAITWAASMSNEKERIDVQVDIARRWNATAPNEAQAWIAANLPPEAQVRAMAPRR